MESPENQSACFPPFPQTLEIARTAHREMKIMRSDSHIPSATTKTASMNQIQYTKGQNPLRLPFAAFRLIFGLEKTGTLISVHSEFSFVGRLMQGSFAPNGIDCWIDKKFKNE